MIGRAFAVVAAIIIGAAMPSPAAAEDVAVAEVSGPQGKKITRAIAKQLRAEGHSVAIVATAADAEGVSAIVVATAKKKGKRWRLQIVVRDGSDDSLLGEATMTARSARRLPRQVRRLFIKRLGDAIEAGTTADAEAEPADDAEPAADPAPAGPATGSATTVTAAVTSTPRPRLGEEGESSLIDATFAVSGRVFSRRLSYRDDIFGMLPQHQADGTPALVVTASGFVGRYGARAELAYTWPFDSRTPDDVAFPTEALGYVVGGRVRVLDGDLKLAVGADYGGRDITIGPADMQAKPQIPDAEYRFLRASTGVETALGGAMSAGGEVGYRYVLSTGELESDDYFPRLSAGGVDAALWLRVRVMGPVHVAVSANLERYFLSLNPEPGDPLIAGGALDQLIGGQLGVEVEY